MRLIFLRRRKVISEIRILIKINESEWLIGNLIIIRINQFFSRFLFSQPKCSGEIQRISIKPIIHNYFIFCFEGGKKSDSGQRIWSWLNAENVNTKRGKIEIEFQSWDWDWKNWAFFFFRFKSLFHFLQLELKMQIRNFGFDSGNEQYFRVGVALENIVDFLNWSIKFMLIINRGKQIIRY